MRNLKVVESTRRVYSEKPDTQNKENMNFAARSTVNSLALPYISQDELKAMSSKTIIYRCKRKVDSNIPVTIPVRGLPPLGKRFFY